MGWVDFLIVFLAIGLVAMLALIWAVYFRKKERRRRKHRYHQRRKLNPTLADIGGLPPVREEESSSGQTPPTPQS